MKSLSTYIDPALHHIDGHIHLFDRWGDNQAVFDWNFEKYVGFIDVEPKYKDYYQDCSELYDKYIDKFYNDRMILLASGMNPDDIINIYNRHKDVIKGFGELKCYDSHKGHYLPYKDNMDWVMKILKFSSENGNLPVYVHYTLSNHADIGAFEAILSSFPSVPIILCHLGMDRENNELSNNEIFDELIWLMESHNNLWTDCSFVGLEYLYTHQERVQELDPSRVILGTDTNPALFRMCDKDPDDYNISRYKMMQAIKMPSDDNIKHLFKL